MAVWATCWSAWRTLSDGRGSLALRRTCVGVLTGALVGGDGRLVVGAAVGRLLVWLRPCFWNLTRFRLVPVLAVGVLVGFEVTPVAGGSTGVVVLSAGAKVDGGSGVGTTLGGGSGVNTVGGTTLGSGAGGVGIGVDARTGTVVTVTGVLVGACGSGCWRMSASSSIVLAWESSVGGGWFWSRSSSVSAVAWMSSVVVGSGIGAVFGIHVTVSDMRSCRDAQTHAR
jgi:hypothetical protein